MTDNRTFISPRELQRLVAQRDRSVAVIDVSWLLGRDVGKAYYERAHLPNAKFIEFEKVLSDLPGGKGRHPLPQAKDVEEALSKVGVNSSDFVVFYDQGDSLAASRGALTLRHFGHQSVAVLLGGFQRWTAEGNAVSTEIASVEASEFRFDEANRKEIFVEVNYVLEGKACLIDVREQVRYLGISEPIDKVAGHIPGALNLPYSSVFHPTTGLNQHVLESFFTEHRLGPDSLMTTYCGSGVTASFMALALEYLGMQDAKVYVGSWSEWVEDPTREVSVNTE